MRSRRIAALAAGLAMVVTLTACSDDEGGGGDGVALIIAQGGLGDESYNDLANSGFQKALEETGQSGAPVESDDIVGQGEQILRRAADENGLVIDLEFSHAELIADVAKDYPDVNFAIVNAEAEGDNVVSVLFQEQEGSYLAGTLAALMTSQPNNPKLNPEKVIGVIGGTKSTGIDKFVVGFMQGAQAADPEVHVLTSYTEDFGDPSKGKSAAETLYQQGADIVFHVAGGAGLGVIEAAEATNHYAIGVDTDQDGIAPGFVLTSMVKHTDTAVRQLVEDFDAGDVKGGTTMSLGLDEGGVGLTEFEHTKADIPQSIVDQIGQLEQQIIADDIDVWNVIEDGYPEWYPGS